MPAESATMQQHAAYVGMYERHLLRRDGNPLFRLPAADYSANEVLQARQRDSEELQQFHQEMREAIQQAIELPGNVASEVILELRGRLDQLYTRCSGFGNSCREHKENLRKLIDLVMKAVWQAAADDPQARLELEQEEMARQQHYRLLEYPLVADLLRPDTPIASDELVPSLLLAADDELEAVMWLFEREQLRQICNEAETLLQQRRAEGFALPQAWEKLQFMREHLED
ncbi:MAG: hypothetical protein OQL08_12635 [Gammaproteobacteria bacterium]|nr:hypothetical protein [Gammaproteobacteria bacterium]